MAPHLNTRLLMTVTSICLAIAGAACLFAPAELAAALDWSGGPSLTVMLQLTGALYLAFAMANWSAKGAMIGGIYSRPLSIANLLHFMVGALSLLKYAFSQGWQLPIGIALTVYVVFAAMFIYLVFGFNPIAPVGAPRELLKR